MFTHRCLLRAFDTWNPLLDKVSPDQSPCFIEAVEGAQKILQERTLEELKKGLEVIDWIVDDWWEKYNECEWEELKKKALAGDQEALQYCEVTETPVGGLMVNMRDTVEEGIVVPGFIPQPRGTLRDFLVLQEALPNYELDNMDFRARKAYEVYAVLCLAKAAQAMNLIDALFAVAASLPGAPLTKLPFGADVSFARKDKGSTFTRHEYNMFRDKEFFVIEAIEAFHYAECLIHQEQGTVEPMLDRKIKYRETAVGKAAISEKMSLNGKKGAMVANMKRNAVREFAREKYYKGLQEERWKSPLAAAKALLAAIKTEAQRIHAGCLQGSEDSALQTVYLKYILPYHRELDAERDRGFPPSR